MQKKYGDICLASYNPFVSLVQATCIRSTTYLYCKYKLLVLVVPDTETNKNKGSDEVTFAAAHILRVIR